MSGFISFPGAITEKVFSIRFVTRNEIRYGEREIKEENDN